MCSFCLGSGRKMCVHVAFLDFLATFVWAVHIDIDTVPSSEV